MVSGGIDSFVAYHKLNKPKCVFVDYGQIYYDMEMAAINKLYDDVTIVKIDGLPQLGSDIHIPARNMMFCTIGVRFASTIVLAGVGDEICSDKSVSEFLNMSKILSRHSGFKVNVVSPLWSFTKESAIAQYLARGGDSNKLLDTVSCYSDKLCYNCEACFRRAIALACNGIITPLCDDIIRQQFSKLAKFDQYRQSSIIRGLRVLGKKIQIVRMNDVYDDDCEFHVLASCLPKHKHHESFDKFDAVVFNQLL